MAAKADSQQMMRFWSRVGALLGVLLAGSGLAFWSLEGTILNVFSLVFLILGLGLVVWGIAANAMAVSQAVRSKRGALGLNELILVGLAVVLAVIVNYWSFSHYQRHDWTRDQQFTIPAETQKRLRRLKEPIDIVVYIAHKTFGRAGKKPDAYDYGAERKVVEKVRDLAEQYGQIGAQIRVQVLDVEEEGYENRLGALPKPLREELAKAVENSIFFRSGKRVRRLSFSDYYQLDKKESRAKQNLVLRARGQKSFSRQIFNIDEPRPNLVFAVVHELLGLESEAEFGLKGLAGALDRWGIDGRTVILKEWSEMGPPKAAVMSFKESQFRRLTDQVQVMDEAVKQFQEELADTNKFIKELEESDLKELEEKFKSQLRGQKFTPEIRQNTLALYRQVAAQNQRRIAVFAKKREVVEQAVGEFDKTEIEQMARFTRLDEKLDYVLQDCDLLVVPRYTWQKVNLQWGIPNEVYQVEEPQVDALRSYLRAGRPMLACLGPSTEMPPSPMRRPPPPKPPLFENLLRDYGVELDRKLILFEDEIASFKDRFATGTVPPLAFENPKLAASGAKPAEPNPISVAMTSLVRARDQALNVQARHPRIVRYTGDTLPYDPHFAWTDSKSWSETNPFPSMWGGKSVPKYDAPDKLKVATAGDSMPEGDEQRGPLPVGVAIERPSNPRAKEGSKTTRLGVVGKAALYTGAELAPENEKLFVDLANWLLRRDYLLGLETTEWSYPRMEIGLKASARWLWFLRLGMPLLCAFFGAVVLMYRRVH